MTKSIAKPCFVLFCARAQIVSKHPCQGAGKNNQLYDLLLSCGANYDSSNLASWNLLILGDSVDSDGSLNATGNVFVLCNEVSWAKLMVTFTRYKGSTESNKWIALSIILQIMCRITYVSVRARMRMIKCMLHNVTTSTGHAYMHDRSYIGRPCTSTGTFT